MNDALPILQSSTEGHSEEINDICEDSEYIYTAADDNTVKIWQKESLQEIAILQHGDLVNSICVVLMIYIFTPLPIIIVSGDGKKILEKKLSNLLGILSMSQMWKLIINSYIVSLTSCDDYLSSIAVDKEFIYATSASGVTIFGKKSWIDIAYVSAEEMFVNMICTDEDYLYLANGDGSIKIVGKNSWSALATTKVNKKAINFLSTDEPIRNEILKLKEQEVLKTLEFAAEEGVPSLHGEGLSTVKEKSQISKFLVLTFSSKTSTLLVRFFIKKDVVGRKK